MHISNYSASVTVAKPCLCEAEAIEATAHVRCVS